MEEESQYENEEKVLHKTRVSLKLKGKEPEEADSFVTEGHVVIKTNEEITIPISRIKNCDTFYSFQASDSGASNQELQTGTVALTFVDDSNKKQKLELLMDMMETSPFKRTVDDQRKKLK